MELTGILGEIRSIRRKPEFSEETETEVFD
jgi:hypothetical protein